MRIGVLSFDGIPPLGGMGVMIDGLSSALAEQENMTVVRINPTASATDSIHPFLKKWYGKMGSCPLTSIFLYCVLPSIIPRWNIDVLHVHAGSGGIVLLTKPSVPTLVTAHHTYEQERSIVFSKWSRAWITKWFMARFEKRTYQLADGISAVSEDTKTSLIHDYGIDASRITVIENALPERSFENPSIKTTTIIPQKFLSLGRLESRKGTHTLLRAWRAYYANHRNSHLTLVGKNLLPTDEWNHLLQECEHSVTLCGHVSEEVKQDMLRSHDVLIVPSLLEGFGLTAIEGMAAGIPVLARNAPGLRTLIRHRETGYLFKDEGDLLQLLISITKDGIPSHISSQAYKEAVTRFALLRQREKYSEALRIIEKKGAKRNH